MTRLTKSFDFGQMYFDMKINGSECKRVFKNSPFWLKKPSFSNFFSVQYFAFLMKKTKQKQNKLEYFITCPKYFPYGVDSEKKSWDDVFSFKIFI